MSGKNITIVIPTYKRSELLESLIRDLIRQTVQPGALIVVDGDPGANDVREMLPALPFPDDWHVIYIPSNHANAPFQRYLGWRVASESGCDALIYFDDDLRLREPDAVAKVIAPFTWNEPDVLGVTADIQIDDVAQLPGTEALRDKRWAFLSTLVKRYGLSARIPPGGLSPVGHRRLPDCDEQVGYAIVQWLRGRVMAYRMEAIHQNCFSEDAFAMAHIRCGLGVDDTVLSRDICSSGKMLVAFGTGIEHPHEDVPRAYPYQARKLAYATAYSRRFHNDHYRSPFPPTLPDRLTLLKNYVGITAFAWLSALTSFKDYRFAYALGYTHGAVRGLIQRPTAKNLTPHIDWWGDADKALSKAERLRP